MRRNWIIAALAAGLLALAGCGAGTTSSGGTASGGTRNAGPAAHAAATDLATWESPVGQIVIDGRARAVYVFDKDTPGSGRSACTDPTCTATWHAVTSTAATPTAAGVTGTLGTITGEGGARQVTLDGHPLYTYAGDTASGMISGQGVQGLWWLVSPSGQKITASAAASSSSSGGYSY